MSEEVKDARVEKVTNDLKLIETFIRGIRSQHPSMEMVTVLFKWNKEDSQDLPAALLVGEGDQVTAANLVNASFSCADFNKFAIATMAEELHKLRTQVIQNQALAEAAKNTQEMNEAEEGGPTPDYVNQDKETDVEPEPVID